MAVGALAIYVYQLRSYRQLNTHRAHESLVTGVVAFGHDFPCYCCDYCHFSLTTMIFKKIIQEWTLDKHRYVLGFFENVLALFSLST